MSLNWIRNNRLGVFYGLRVVHRIQTLIKSLCSLKSWIVNMYSYIVFITITEQDSYIVSPWQRFICQISRLQVIYGFSRNMSHYWPLSACLLCMKMKYNTNISTEMMHVPIVFEIKSEQLTLYYICWYASGVPTTDADRMLTTTRISIIVKMGILSRYRRTHTFWMYRPCFCYVAFESYVLVVICAKYCITVTS